MSNIYDELDKSRKPRVHIKYEVETEGGTVSKELPFVVGVMGDFSGDPTQPLKPFSERKFIQVDRNNFDDVMSKMNPGLDLRVDNKISNNNTEIAVHLEFNSLSDFEPENIVRQVPVLNKLLETRNKLRELITQVDRSEELESILEKILQTDINFAFPAHEDSLRDKNNEND